MPLALLEHAEEDFLDLAFAVASLDWHDDGGVTADLVAEHEGMDLALRVVVRGGLRPGLDGESGVHSDALVQDAVFLQRLDARSDALLDVWCRLAGVERPARRMRPSMVCAAFALQEHPVALASGPCQLKVYHDRPRILGAYAEAFLNLDLPDGLVSLDEEDARWRGWWARALSDLTGELPPALLLRDPGTIVAVPTRRDLDTALDALRAGKMRRVTLDTGRERLVLVQERRAVAALRTDGTTMRVTEPLPLPQARALARDFLKGLPLPGAGFRETLASATTERFGVTAP